MQSEEARKLKSANRVHTIMNGKIWKFLLFAAATAFVVSIIPDVKRYVRISTM